MYYRSISDLNECIVKNIHLVPKDIDLVVGVPRSGLIPATLIALYRNIPVLALDAACDNVTPIFGSRLQNEVTAERPDQSTRILVIDDSHNRGAELSRVRARIKNSVLQNANIIYAAVYKTVGIPAKLDFFFEELPYPRVFEWNIFNHPILEHSCLDFDGVLCRDPKSSENDDGYFYRIFLKEAEPRFVPKREIHSIVTSRLERYRPETEEWLLRHKVKYKKLIMLNGFTADERRLKNIHATFKGEYFKNSDTDLFVESNRVQAESISLLAGKPVFCSDTRIMYFPDASSTLFHGSETLIRISKRKISRLFRRLSEKVFSRLPAARGHL